MDFYILIKRKSGKIHQEKVEISMSKSESFEIRKSGIEKVQIFDERTIFIGGKLTQVKVEIVCIYFKRKLKICEYRTNFTVR